MFAASLRIQTFKDVFKMNSFESLGQFLDDIRFEWLIFKIRKYGIKDIKVAHDSVTKLDSD